MAEQSPLRVVADANAKKPTDRRRIRSKSPKPQETVAEAPSSNSAPAAAVAASWRQQGPPPAQPHPPRPVCACCRWPSSPAAIIYVNGGQVMSTDNAYIQADMVGLTTDVSGIVDQINVHENETVKAGQVLFSLKIRQLQDRARRRKGRNSASSATRSINLKASYRQSLAEITQAQADMPVLSRRSSTVSRASSTVRQRDAVRPTTKPSTTLTLPSRRWLSPRRKPPTTLRATRRRCRTSRSNRTRSYLQAQSAVDNAERDLDRMHCAGRRSTASSPM